MKKPKDVRLIEHYAEEFDSGVVNEANYLESAAFLRGLYTVMDAAGSIDSAGTSAFERAISTLQGGASLVRFCRHNPVTVKVYE